MFLESGVLRFMSQLPLDSSFESQTGSVPELPDRLVKHAVKYTDHRSVVRDDLTPMMRHYADKWSCKINYIFLSESFEHFFDIAIPGLVRYYVG